MKHIVKAEHVYLRHLFANVFNTQAIVNSFCHMNKTSYSSSINSSTIEFKS